MSGEHSYLNHELLNHSVKGGALVVQGLPRLAVALLTCAETPEVLNRLGNQVGIKFHCNAASSFAANGDVKKDTRSGGGFSSHGEWFGGRVPPSRLAR